MSAKETLWRAIDDFNNSFGRQNNSYHKNHKGAGLALDYLSDFFDKGHLGEKYVPKTLKWYDAFGYQGGVLYLLDRDGMCMGCIEVLNFEKQEIEIRIYNDPTVWNGY